LTPEKSPVSGFELSFLIAVDTISATRIATRILEARWNMRGRKPKLNWTPCHGQYTVTIDKKLHRLGTDRADAGANTASS
jgi:hypothetical protein